MTPDAYSRSAQRINDRSLSLLALLLAAGTILPPFLMPPAPRGDSQLFASVAHSIAELPPTAAGVPSARDMHMPGTPQPPVESYLGGTRATGRVADIYLKVDDNVFLSEREAPEHLRASAERWVDIEFPELLARDTGAARARLNKTFARVRVGDVVEIKFAHKDNPRYFPVKEVTRVTQLLARTGEMLAQDYERRILVRTGRAQAHPAWLLKARGEAATSTSEVAAAGPVH